jgi:hypothetical protein
MTEHSTAGPADGPDLIESRAVPATGRDPRSLPVRTALLATVAAAIGSCTLAGSAAGSPGQPATVGGGTGLAGRVAVAGGTLECGGIRLGVAALPGRPVGADERTGPAEGISQVLRLFEWTRRTPYDGVAWSVADAGNGTALLVATARAGSARYIPVRRLPDGHWQIDAPCRLHRPR